MTALLSTLSQTPVLNDLEALYQRVYSTPERQAKTDRFLARVMIAMSVIMLLQTASVNSVCGVGA